MGTHNSRGIVVFSLFLKKVIITHTRQLTLRTVLQSPVLTQDGQKHFPELIYLPWFFNMFVSPSVYCVDVQQIVSELKCVDAVRSILDSQQFVVSRAVVLIYSIDVWQFNK